MKSEVDKDDRTLKVFLSYAVADKDYGDKLHNLLTHYLNARVFTQDSLSAGDDWRGLLKDQLTDSNIFIVLVSPNSIESSWVWQELGAAWALKKPVVSVFTESQLCSRLPVELSNVQYVNLKEFEDPQSLNRIFKNYMGDFLKKKSSRAKSKNTEKKP